MSSAPVAMPRTTRYATLILGPITVTVGLKAFSSEEKIHAKTLCPCHMLPAKQGYTCAESGEVVEPVKRYEVGDSYVELDPADLKTPTDTTVELTASPWVERVDAAYYGKPYLIWPKSGFETQFDMLAEAIRESKRVLIGTVVFTNRTEVIGFRWSDEFDVLVAETLAYGDSIAHADINLVRAGRAARPAPSAEYVKLIAELISTLADDYHAEAYTNDYAARMWEALEAASNGQPIPRPAPARTQGEVVDLMEALKKSVASAKKPRAKSTTRKPAARKTTARKKVA